MITLIVEKGDNELWGRVNYNDNLIIDTAEDLTELQEKFKVLLRDLEGLDVDEFEVLWDNGN